MQSHYRKLLLFLFIFASFLLASLINTDSKAYAACCACTGGYCCGSTFGAEDMCCTGGGCPSWECTNTGGRVVTKAWEGKWVCIVWNDSSKTERIDVYDATYFTGTCVYCSVDPVDGDCGNTHYNCDEGNSTNNGGTTTTWTWKCTGTDGGSTASCSENKPINGVCAVAHYNCIKGTSIFNRASDSLVWTWSCRGSYGGTTAACSQNKPINGLCSATHYVCTEGTSVNKLSNIIPWTWTWDCRGFYNGSTDNCTQNKPIDGVCSAAHYVCTTGTSINRSSNTTPWTWSWDCRGFYNGSTDNCVEDKAPVVVNGVCAVTHYACTKGTSTDNSNSTVPGQWTWKCEGSGGGSTADCSQYKPINGVCAVTHYACNKGTSTNNSSTTTPGKWTWDCEGLYDGATATCSEDKPASVDGVCALTHYDCDVGTSILNRASDPLAWTWSCRGFDGGGTDDCTEDKPVNGVCAATHYNCTSGISTDGSDNTIPWNWTWKCLGSGGGTDASCVEDKTTCDQIPTAPTLASPPDGASFSSSNVNLSWGASTYFGNSYCTSKAYRLLVDDETSFSLPRTVALSYPTTTLSSTVVLPAESKTYYWNVRACNQLGCSNASNGYRNFSVVCGVAPGAAHTPSPASGAANVSLPLTATWAAPASWGTACGIPNNNRYTVYAKVKSGASCDAPNPAAYTAIPGCVNIPDSSTSCDMSGFVINNTSYCWFVKTSNGTESTLSAASAAGVWWFKTEDPLLYQNWVTTLYGDFYTGSLSEEYPSLATHIAPWNPPYAVYESLGGAFTSFISNSSASITTDNTNSGYSPLSQSGFWVTGANFKNTWPASYRGTPPADATSLPLGGGSDCTKVFTAAPKLDPSKVYKGTAGCISQAVNNSNGNYQLSGSKGYVVVYVTGGGSLNINKPFITDNDDFRVIFVTGEGVSVKVSNNSDMKIATPNLSSQPLVEAAFVVSKSIEFTGSADPKTSPDESIVVEGPIIAKSVQFDRNRGSSNMYPSEIVKYNSNYIYNLTDKERTSAKSNISGLFVIDVDWLEGE